MQLIAQLKQLHLQLPCIRSPKKTEFFALPAQTVSASVAEFESESVSVYLTLYRGTLR